MADLVKDFYEWRATTDGEKVYQEVVRRARVIRERGFRHFGIRCIWEVIRYDYAVQLGPDHGFRLNDHYHAFIAREVMRNNTDLEGFFELRTSVADDVDLAS